VGKRFFTNGKNPRGKIVFTGQKLVFFHQLAKNYSQNYFSNNNNNNDRLTAFDPGQPG